jgi:flagellar hook-length control protein FliK
MSRKPAGGFSTVEKIEIKLYPAELGKLDVHLRMEDGILHLVINASDQATGNYLQNHLGELRQSLTQIGISCGSMEMSFQGEREQENEGNAPENHDYYRPTEEESISYGKAMYNMQDLMTKTRINVSI